MDNPIHNEGFVSLTSALNRVGFSVPYGSRTRSLGNSRVHGVRASAVESYEGSSSFVNRMEKAWLISKVVVVNILIFVRSSHFPYIYVGLLQFCNV